MDGYNYLITMLANAKTVDLGGIERKATGTINKQEADFIIDLIGKRKSCYCLETGVAYGAYSIAICTALSKLEKLGYQTQHYGVDPCQYVILTALQSQPCVNVALRIYLNS